VVSVRQLATVGDRLLTRVQPFQAQGRRHCVAATYRLPVAMHVMAQKPLYNNMPNPFKLIDQDFAS
jgi:hypothetical protein